MEPNRTSSFPAVLSQILIYVACGLMLTACWQISLEREWQAIVLMVVGIGNALVAIALRRQINKNKSAGP